MEFVFPDFNEKDRACLEKSNAWKKHPRLVEEISRVLAHADPEGLSLWSGYHPSPLTEYMPEVEAIVERLRHVADQQGLARVIEDVFQQWFGDDTSVQDGSELARKIWPVVEESVLNQGH